MWRKGFGAVVTAWKSTAELRSQWQLIRTSKKTREEVCSCWLLVFLVCQALMLPFNRWSRSESFHFRPGEINKKKNEHGRVLRARSWDVMGKRTTRTGKSGCWLLMNNKCSLYQFYWLNPSLIKLSNNHRSLIYSYHQNDHLFWPFKFFSFLWHAEENGFPPYIFQDYTNRWRFSFTHFWVGLSGEVLFYLFIFLSPVFGTHCLDPFVKKYASTSSMDYIRRKWRWIVLNPLVGS